MILDGQEILMKNLLVLVAVFLAGCATMHPPSEPQPHPTAVSQIHANDLVTKAHAMCMLHLKPEYRFYLVNTPLLKPADPCTFFADDSQSDVDMMHWFPSVNVLLRVDKNAELDQFEKRNKIPSVFIARVSIQQLAKEPHPAYWSAAEIPKTR